MELEPFITAGAAVAFSVAGYLISNQRSKTKALRATRSESDLKKMGADAALPKSLGAAMEAAAALHYPEGSETAVPTNSPKGFRRGLNIGGAHSNVLQRTSIARPHLPTLLEEPKELEEAQEEEDNKESETESTVETEKGINLENGKEIKCDKFLKGDEEIISDKPNSLFVTKIEQSKVETETKVAHISDYNFIKTKDETKSIKPYSQFPPKVGQPRTKLEQENTSAKVRDWAIEWAHTVRDLLEEDESDEEESDGEESEKEEEIKCLHILPQTLLETKEESICIRRQPYAAPKVAQEEFDVLEKENQIEKLHALAETLLEKERDLEVQMLEYYGLKEQQEAVKEMENLSKVNSSKAKFLSLKVESLGEENEKLKNKILELEKITDKIDRNKEKINMLKKRLSSEDNNAKEKIALLRESIETLADKKDKSAADYEEIERKLERVKGLEEEVNDLKKVNARLEEEKSGLAHRLEDVQLVASSTIRGPEEQVLEEATRLREKNEKLEQEVAELKNTHYLSVEEVVYLRWLNACLRHELTDYNPSKGKGVASELNKSPSYQSREKVKQLLQEYSNLGINITETNLVDFDFDSSSSQAPSVFPSPSHEQVKHPKKSTKKTFGKFMKFVMGKGSSHAEKDKMTSLASENASVSYSADSSPLSSMMTVGRSPRPEKHPRPSLNIARQKSFEPNTARSSSDLGLLDVRRGEPRRYHALHLGDHSPIETDDREREEMKKNAPALNRSKPTGKS